MQAKGPVKIKRIKTLLGFNKVAPALEDSFIQEVDFSRAGIDWRAQRVSGATFVSCHFEALRDELTLREQGAYVLPR
ncbi:MAG: hypothetical protein M3O15_06535, partial [Acidobacteriota bacterium]|nr:hypothetical protein [Acidobacteriota bacterium]